MGKFIFFFFFSFLEIEGRDKWTSISLRTLKRTTIKVLLLDRLQRIEMLYMYGFPSSQLPMDSQKTKTRPWNEYVCCDMCTIECLLFAYRFFAVLEVGILFTHLRQEGKS